jgi:hypothetical protein
MVINAYMVEAREIAAPEAPDSPAAMSQGTEFVGDGSQGHVKRERSQATATELVSERVSATAIVSSLSPEVRYNAVAMVCAIAAPSLILHRKLRRHKF